MISRISIAIGALLLSGPAISHAQWTLDVANTSYYWAATTNSEAQAFGQYCYHESRQCLWLVGIPTKCEQGSKYPALVNSTSGSGSVELYCTSQGDRQNVLAFTDFDQIDRFVRESERLGIAIPLQDDKFRVFRFEVSGASFFLDKMREAALRRQPRKGKKGNVSGSGAEYL